MTPPARGAADRRMTGAAAARCLLSRGVRRQGMDAGREPAGMWDRRCYRRASGRVWRGLNEAAGRRRVPADWGAGAARVRRPPCATQLALLPAHCGADALGLALTTDNSFTQCSRGFKDWSGLSEYFLRSEQCDSAQIIREGCYTNATVLSYTVQLLLAWALCEWVTLHCSGVSSVFVHSFVHWALVHHVACRQSGRWASSAVSLYDPVARRDSPPVNSSALCRLGGRRRLSAITPGLRASVVPV